MPIVYVYKTFKKKLSLAIKYLKCDLFQIYLVRSFFLILLFNYNLHSILCCISFNCMAQWLDNPVLYKVFP